MHDWLLVKIASFDRRGKDAEAWVRPRSSVCGMACDGIFRASQAARLALCYVGKYWREGYQRLRIGPDILPRGGLATGRKTWNLQVD
jgi:hypothetical protein